MPLRGSARAACAMLPIISVVLAESGGPTISWMRPRIQPPRRSAQSRVRLPVGSTWYAAGSPVLGASRLP